MLLLNSNSGRLLHNFERDVRVASRQKKSPKSKSKKEDNWSSSLLKSIQIFAGYLIKAGVLYLKSSVLINVTKFTINRDHRRFIKSDTAGKDEVYSKWERIKFDIQSNLKPINELEITTALLKPTISNLREFISICLNFEKKLKTEYQDYLNINLSQDYLKELSSKFAHLSQDVLDDLISDRYS